MQTFCSVTVYCCFYDNKDNCGSAAGSAPLLCFLPLFDFWLLTLSGKSYLKRPSPCHWYLQCLLRRGRTHFGCIMWLWNKMKINQIKPVIPVFKRKKSSLKCRPYKICSSFLRVKNLGGWMCFIATLHNNYFKFSRCKGAWDMPVAGTVVTLPLSLSFYHLQ